MSLRDLAYLRDIRDAGERAIDHMNGLSVETLAANPHLQDGVVRCLIVMGEAAKNVSAATRDEFSDFDWRAMVGLRNVLVHRYMDIDLHQLYVVVHRDPPPVIERLSGYLFSRQP